MGKRNENSNVRLGFKDAIKKTIVRKNCNRLKFKSINDVTWTAYTDYKMHPKAAPTTESVFYVSEKQLCKEMTKIINDIRLFVISKDKPMHYEITDELITAWVTESNDGEKIGLLYLDRAVSDDTEALLKTAEQALRANVVSQLFGFMESKRNFILY